MYNIKQLDVNKLSTKHYDGVVLFNKRLNLTIKFSVDKNSVDVYDTYYPSTITVYLYTKNKVICGEKFKVSTSKVTRSLNTKKSFVPKSKERIMKEFFDKFRLAIAKINVSVDSVNMTNEVAGELVNLFKDAGFDIVENDT